MRLHRFYINFPILEDEIIVKDEGLLHQWRNVFRYNVGSEVIIFDGSGSEFSVIFKQLTNREAHFQIVSKRQGLLPKRQICLYQSLIKKDKMEWVIEKATELGVSKIIPIISERSEKKSFNLERARKIAIEASEQCGRADVPEIVEILDLDEALETARNILAFDVSGESLELRTKSLEQKSSPEISSSKPQALSLFIGPEGGWSEKEIELFKKRKAEVCSLGLFTLRAETATIVALGSLGPPGL